MAFALPAAPKIDPKITALVTSGVLLTSCAVPITRDERIGPDDGTDSCRPYVVALDSTGNFFAEDMIKGAVVGAATGAIVGGLAAVLAGKKEDIGKGVLIGAAVGGVAGAMGGYYKSRMQQGRDQAVLDISNDLERESEALDRTDLAMQKLIACRVGQRDKVRADYAAQRISRSDAQARWSTLQAQVARDDKVMQMVAENIGKRQEEYAYANNQMAEEFDISKLPPSEQRAAKASMVAYDKEIDAEYKKEVASIEREYKVTKKSAGKKKAAPEVEHAKKQRIAAAKAHRDQKKTVNRKTGGSSKAVKLAKNYSSTQNKASTAIKTAKNYSSNMGVADSNGFEKADTGFWHNASDRLYVIAPKALTRGIDLHYMV